MIAGLILVFIKEITILFFKVIIIFSILFLTLFWLSKKLFPDLESSPDIPTNKQGIFIITIFCLIFPWLVDWISYLEKYPLLTYKIANYHYTSYILNFTDKIGLSDTNISYLFRNNLFKQYMNIKKSFPNNVYNAIGCYNIISDEYNIYFKNNSNTKEKYKSYNSKYLKELKNIILTEYPQRNTTLYIFAGYKKWNDYFSYRISNRLVFYPYLAVTYLFYTKLIYSEQTIEDLINILKIYDDIFNQEKNNESWQYKDFQIKSNQEKFNDFYPIFINEYSKAIILMTNEIDKENICTKTDIFDYYLNSLNYGLSENPEIMHIIKDECGYN